MLSWFSNPWIVGLGTGVLSGLLVAWLLSRKKDREYLQKAASANRDIVLAIRTGIPEGVIPPPAVVAALIHSTARRYNVTVSDLFLPEEIAEELIKEVMDSSFLSAAKKAEYCSELAPLSTAPPARFKTEPAPSESSTAAAKRRSDLDRASTLLITFLTALISGLLTARLSPGAKASVQELFRPLIIALAIPTLVIFFIVEWRKRVRELMHLKELERRAASADDRLTRP